jgi:hypothetical protein
MKEHLEKVLLVTKTVRWNSAYKPQLCKKHFMASNEPNVSVFTAFTLLVVILFILYFFYFNRLSAFLISRLIRLYTWNAMEIYINIGKQDRHAFILL